MEVVFECDRCRKEVELSLYDEKTGVCNVCLCENTFRNMYISGKYLVLSIDIGIRHLALVLSDISEKYEFEKIVWFDLVDITKYDCQPDCPFFHTKTFADWIRHFIDKYEWVFAKADRILIERQPPQGLVVVEQLLFGCFREKSILISPNSVHKHFQIGHHDYDNRKKAVVNLTRNYFSREFGQQLDSYDRAHDICDAVLFTLYWAKKEQERVSATALLKKRQESMQRYNEHVGMSLDDFFDTYRYIPKC